MSSLEMSTIEFVLFISIIFGYMSIIVILVNIFLYKTPKQAVHNTHCSEGKCKNELFEESRFCYWHDPVRKMMYPLGSEMTPRRSQRIAEQKGMYYTFK